MNKCSCVVVVMKERVLLGNLSCPCDRFVVAWSCCYCKYTFLRTFPACNQSPRLCPEAGSTQKVKYKIGRYIHVLIDFSLTVKAVTLIFISGRCSASPSAKQEKSGSIIIW